MEFTNVVTIARPVSEVFRYLEDFEHVPEWNYAIVETKKVSAGPVGVGTTYRQTRSLPRRAEETFEVIVHEPDRALAIEGDIGPLYGVLSYELELVPEGTKVTNAATLEGRGVGRVLGALGGDRVREAVAANLGKLKEIMERSGGDLARG